MVFNALYENGIIPHIQIHGKDKQWHHGSYLFTVDWAHPDANILDTDHSEIPHEHKCAHIIALDDGNYAAQPNNRCIWDLPSFTVKDNIPLEQTNEWNVEDTGAWKDTRHRQFLL